jgi:hypothetical protein
MEADDRPIRPGDLVHILSCFEPGTLVKNCPPGLVIEVRVGVPSTGGQESEETDVCAILWRGVVDRWVDVEWLCRVIDGGYIITRRYSVYDENEFEDGKCAQSEDDESE